MKDFINREKEIKVLKEKLSSKSFELIVIYGRRRIGKTKLILKVLNELRRGNYYFCVQSLNMQHFKRDLKIEYIADDWIFLFENFTNDILVIDEFPYLVKEFPEIPSILQKLIDTKWQNTSTKLVLIGSSLSMMEKLTLSGKSPLYGRTTLVMEIKEIDFITFAKYFWKKKYALENIVNIYGFSGGIPFYFKKINTDTIEDYVDKEIKDEYSYIHNEALFLVKEEFDQPKKYFQILHAIAFGKETRKEIRDFVKLRNEDISPYLENLMKVGMVSYIQPIFSKNSKLRRYKIKDNFLRFWFRFIFPNKTKIEQKIFSFKELKKEYADYIGTVFEDIAIQILKRWYPRYYFGKYWRRSGQVEIDVIGISEKSKEILAVEVKWQDLKLRDVKRIIEELHEKLPYVQWENDKRKEILGIFAKKVEKKAREWLISQGYKVWDLSDVEKII